MYNLFNLYLEFGKLEETANFTPSESEIMKSHKKLGHVNERDLKEMDKNKMIRGLDFKEKTLGTCETCIKGKFSTLPFQSHGQIISTEVLQIIHSVAHLRMNQWPDQSIS